MRLRSKAADLAKRVNAGVGASGGVYNDVLLRHAPKHASDFPLNRRLVRLNLPAVEIGAVIRDGEFEIAHGKKVINFQLSVFRGRISSSKLLMSARARCERSGFPASP